MKRLALVFVFLLLMAGTGLLYAQEITGFKATRIDKRYEIKYDLNNFSWNERCDVYFFAKAEGATEWFKLGAIVGSYLNVETKNSYSILWEPILDYKMFQKYDFKIYAVNRKYVGRDYDYAKTRQVGLVYPRSKESGAFFSINGVQISSSVPIALPVGEYEAGIGGDGVLRGKQTVSVKALSYAEPELSFMDGTLTLKAREPETKFKIMNRIYTTVDKMKIPFGDYVVEVIPPDDVKSIGIQNIKETITVGLNEDVSRIFTFNYGKLTIYSNEPDVTYFLNGKQYSIIKDMKLKPGQYEVQAWVRAPFGLADYEKSNVFSITSGRDVDYTFNFDYGYLSLYNQYPGCTYTVDGARLEGKPEKLKLLVGTHQFEVDYKLPYRPFTGGFVLRAGDEYSETVTFVKDKLLVRQNRRRQFQAYLKTLPFTNVSFDHYFLIEESTEDNNSSLIHYGDYKTKSILNGITISGFQFRGTMLKDYEDLDSIKNVDFFTSVGVLDKISIAKVIGADRYAYLLDWVTLSCGLNMLNPQGTIFSSLELQGAWSAQSPLYKKLDVGGISYTYVRKFYDYVPDEDDTETEPERSIKQTDLSQWGADATFKLGIRMGSLGFLYTYAGARIQEKIGGAWYNSEQVYFWKMYLAWEPEPVSNPAFPSRNSMVNGLTYRVGIGFGIPLSRSAYNTIFG